MKSIAVFVLGAALSLSALAKLPPLNDEAKAKAAEAAAKAAHGGKVHLYYDDLGQAIDLATVLATQPLGTHLYVCGPKGMIAWVKKAAEAGVQICFGTDAGSPAVEHDVIAPELAHMVKVGVCPDNMDALASITIRPARLSKMDHLIGTLEVGKAGDLIVVDGNPDQDLFALERVCQTYVNGKRMHG